MSVLDSTANVIRVSCLFTTRLVFGQIADWRFLRYGVILQAYFFQPETIYYCCCFKYWKLAWSIAGNEERIASSQTSRRPRGIGKAGKSRNFGLQFFTTVYWIHAHNFMSRVCQSGIAMSSCHPFASSLPHCTFFDGNGFLSGPKRPKRYAVRVAHRKPLNCKQ